MASHGLDRVRVYIVNPWVKLFRVAARSPPREEYEKSPRKLTMYDCSLIFVSNWIECRR